MVPESFTEACILVAPVEATSSFLRGSLFGPDAVSKELETIELFDAELGMQIVSGMQLSRVVIPASQRGLFAALHTLEKETQEQLQKGRFVLMLGGEHTVTLGPLRAVKELWGQVGIIQFDAHGDLRDSYEGRRISHACVMRRAREDLDLQLLGIGIRSICEEEAVLVKSETKIQHINARTAISQPESVIAAVERLPENIYLTIDMDVFDPSVAPGVGTPEPGGLSWFHLSEIIDCIATRRKIVAADIVELAPPMEKERTVRLAAKVALRVLLHVLGSEPRRDLSGGLADGEV